MLACLRSLSNCWTRRQPTACPPGSASGVKGAGYGSVTGLEAVETAPVDIPTLLCVLAEKRDTVAAEDGADKFS